MDFAGPAQPLSRGNLKALGSGGKLFSRARINKTRATRANKLAGASYFIRDHLMMPINDSYTFRRRQWPSSWYVQTARARANPEAAEMIGPRPAKQSVIVDNPELFNLCSAHLISSVRLKQSFHVSNIICEQGSRRSRSSSGSGGGSAPYLMIEIGTSNDSLVLSNSRPSAVSCAGNQSIGARNLSIRQIFPRSSLLNKLKLTAVISLPSSQLLLLLSVLEII